MNDEDEKSDCLIERYGMQHSAASRLLTLALNQRSLYSPVPQ